jgi:hypothetical protein
LKQTLKIGGMLLVVAALTMTGIAVAQTDNTTSVFAAADETAPAGETPFRSRIVEWLAPLVDDGTITDEQAAAVADTLAGHMPHLRHGIGRGLVAVREAADFLGMTGQELVEALRDGATLADLADAHGLAAEALIDHLVGVAEERLDEAVADGRITEDQKAEMLAEATERITGLVNGDLERPFLGGGFEGPGGMGRGRQGGGMGGGPCQDAAADSDITDLGA